MPVKTYCPYENKSQRKRRRGVAQSSLSSLRGAITLHANHNHEGDHKDNDNYGDESSGVIPNNDGTIAGDESVLDDFTQATATTPPQSAVKSRVGTENFGIRQRRKRRREEHTGEEGSNEEDSHGSADGDCSKPVLSSSSVQGAAISDSSPALKMQTTNDDGFDDAARGVTEVDTLELNEICSVAFFKATPLAEFRGRCRYCLKKSVKLCSISDNEKPYEFVRYDHLKVARRLTNDIDWKSLCEHHDKREYKRRHHSSNRSSRTALSEIVLALTDPMVIPCCCQSKCVVGVLLDALLMSPSLSVSLQQLRRVRNKKHLSNTTTSTIQRWTPSQQLLLETLRILIFSKSSQLNTSLSDYVRKFVVSRPSFLSTAGREITTKTTVSTLSPNKANRLLSAIYWMLSSLLAASSLSHFLERELVSLGLLLLRRIDGWSIQIDIESQNRYGRDKNNLLGDGCGFCNEDSNGDQSSMKNGLRRPINRKMTVETLSKLHDDGTDIEEKPTFYYNNKPLWRRPYGNHPKQVSLKDVLAMKRNNVSGSMKRCRCKRNNIGRNSKPTNAGPADIVVLSSDWSTVRSRAYKKFLSYVAERRQQQHLQESLSIDIVSPKTMKVQNSDEAFLWWLVHDVALHTEQASQRACIALVAHSLGGPKNPCYFQFVALLFWHGFLSSSRNQRSSSSQWLRLYSEWLSECTVFDQRETAWEAFQPILHYITEQLLSNEHEQPKLGATYCASSTQKSPLGSNHGSSKFCDRDEAHFDLEPSLLACLGYILHHRSHLFETCRGEEKDAPNDDHDLATKSSIENEFRSFVDLLSIHCGESSELWLGQFLDSTRDMVESTLQRLGVLSFSLTESRSEQSKKPSFSDTQTVHAGNNTLINSVATSNWPFREEFSLRKAMGRIDRAVLSLENEKDALECLLSHHLHASRITGENKHIVNSSNTKVPTAPMTDYLHDEGILCLIFSFCGPKRLTKIPLVCKAWKTVSDLVSNSLWESAYVSSFGKYRWPSLDAERRHRISTCPGVNFEDASKKTEKVSKTSWKDVFRQKQIAETMVRFQRNSRTGYKHRTCDYVGCLRILKTAEQERKHAQMHLRALAKQQAASTKKKKLQKQKNRIGTKHSRDAKESYKRQTHTNAT